MSFLAHIRATDFAEQSVQEHLEEVAELARRYGEKVGLGAHAELSGLMHDMGKYTQAFSTYLTNAVLHNDVATTKIDHSTAGAKYLFERFHGKNDLQNFVVETIGMAVLSHHSGLQNFIQLDGSTSDYIRRVAKKELPYYDEVVANFEAVKGNRERVENLMIEAVDEFREALQKVKGDPQVFLYISYLQKLVFSCLIDADRTNTRCFEEQDDTSATDNEIIFRNAYDTMMQTVSEWQKSKKPLNQLRTKMSENCDLLAGEPSSVYTLSIPTGGGKTYASLRYALKHAIEHKKTRIIYVVPYTTILEQNAEAVRQITRQYDLVLEHHANVIDDSSLDEEPDLYRKQAHKTLQLARDNWDYPIVFTTMVQFLDAFFQKGTKKGRRLHNLTNAVIVFDEVQSVPYKHFSLFNTAINFLQKFGNSSLVLCTATQPTVANMKYPIYLKENAEMVPDLLVVAKAFERVRMHNCVTKEGYDAEELADFVREKIAGCSSVLVILNTKTAVRKLFESLQNEEVAVYHLSTSMCPAHRKKILKEIKDKLGKERVICISSQLIEAGVDISFEAVVRSLAGLDSIAQAAGRCNRNKERDRGDVYIVKSRDENLSRLPEIAVGGEVTANYILRDERFSEDMLGPAAIAHYFAHYDAQVRRVISLTPRHLDYELVTLLQDSFKKEIIRKPVTSYALFKTLEQHFEAIDSPTKAVLVPYEEEGKELIAALNEDIYDSKQFNMLMKQAQMYSVNLYEHELRQLASDGLLKPLYQESLFYLDESAYSDRFGVSLGGNEAQGIYAF